MTQKQLPRVGYDIDDTLMSFHRPFMKWASDRYGIDFSKPTGNGFYYQDRHEDMEVDWTGLVNEFTLKQSVDLMTPEPGLVEHLEEFSDTTSPFIITSRPKEHRKVTEQLINKHLSKYFKDLEQNLLMPDELTKADIRPSKAEICINEGAIMFFEDAVHNYEHFLAADIPTKAVLFRTDISVWNHEDLEDGVKRLIKLPDNIEVAHGWSEASEKLRQEIKEA